MAYESVTVSWVPPLTRGPSPLAHAHGTPGDSEETLGPYPLARGSHAHFHTSLSLSLSLVRRAARRGWWWVSGEPSRATGGAAGGVPASGGEGGIRALGEVAQRERERGDPPRRSPPRSLL